MRWVSADHLHEWGRSIEAETTFPGLVADLIWKTAPEIREFRIPRDEKGKIRGLDGYIDAAGGPPFVPDGRSVWEFGTGRSGIKSKANKDYETRTNEFLKKNVSLGDISFVFATPLTWDDPTMSVAQWQLEKREGPWKDVHLIDGTTLEKWLAENPALAADFARNILGLPPISGAQSTDEFWHFYSNKFEPPITEDVVLCGRSSQADDLIQKLLAGVQPQRMIADSEEEVIAFVIAAIRQCDPDQRKSLESMTLVLESQAAATYFSRKDKMIYLTRGSATRYAGQLRTIAPTVIPLAGDSAPTDNLALDRPTTFALAQSLQTMGFSEQRAGQLAIECGRSLTILERRIPGGSAKNPVWASDAKKLKPAMLAGAWDNSNLDDQAALSNLAVGRNYEEIEEELLPLVRSTDPALDFESPRWQMRSSVDAFVHLGHTLSKADLTRLSNLAAHLFGTVPQAPKADDLVISRPLGQSSHSEWIRDGIATTLLQIAVLGEKVGIQTESSTPQEYVDQLIQSLPGLAANSRLISCIGRQLPVLMESAPRPFLEALERLLEGDREFAATVFRESDGFFGPTSPHTYLLWGLEKLAWSPEYLVRVTRILAALARMDPGGKSGNRPIGTLHNIFVPWQPCTNASVAERFSAIDFLIANEEGSAWELVHCLLPKSHDVVMPTSKPTFREFGASERKQPTYGDVWEFNDGIVCRAVALAGIDSNRWQVLIENIGGVGNGSLKVFLTGLKRVLTELSDHKQFSVWNALRAEVNKHSRFSDSDWAVPAETLGRLEHLLSDHPPFQTYLSSAWLFDDWHPDIQGEDKFDEKIVEAARADAVRKILAVGAVDDIVMLAAAVKLPQFVAATLVEVTESVGKIGEALRFGIQRSENVTNFESAICGEAARKFGQVWSERFLEIVREVNLPPSMVSTLLTAWPSIRTTWDFVSSFDHGIADAYWDKSEGYFVRGNVADAMFAAEKFIGRNRPDKAFDALYSHKKNLDTGVLVSVLEKVLMANEELGLQLNSMFGHKVDEVLDTLLANDCDERIVAGLEFSFFPLLEHQRKAFTIHKLMAKSAEYFSEILSLVYSKEEVDRDSLDDVTKRKASTAFRLLWSFTILPGMTESGTDLDREELLSWATGVQRQSTKKGILDVAEIQIGKLLAYSPNDLDQDIWPHRSVRWVIDHLKNDHVERGFLIECFNKRGVHSKELYEGGKQEQALERKYRTWAEGQPHGRTRDVLNRVAEEWKSHAAAEERRAAVEKLGS